MSESCRHCSLPLGIGSVGDFCCRGCQAVYELLCGEELQRFYELRGRSGAPVADLPDAKRDLSWLEDSIDVARGPQEQASTWHLRLDVQGLHCSGCVWLFERLFTKQGGLRIDVNPGLGRVDVWMPGDFDLVAWVRSIERFGYRFGPALKREDRVQRSLLVRTGVSIAIAMNVMFLSAAIYFGLEEGPLYQVVRVASFALCTASVVIGGPVFFRSAWAALRRGMLHLDVPISLGIVLSFAGSCWAFATGAETALYLDSISVFVALMLLGRYLQGRVLDANRKRLLESEGISGLRSLRIEEGQPRRVKSEDLGQGDVLLIPVGDLVPVAATLLSDEASFHSEWISGESRPRGLTAGARVIAGSFNAGRQPVRVQALEDFRLSALSALLQAPSPSCDARRDADPWMHAVSKYYVLGVLLAAAFGFAVHAIAGAGVGALEVAIAILVVTCPCAFGIATPLAHELVASRLRSHGLQLRSPSFLQRAARVRGLVFDKTGTLTTGRLQVKNPEAFAGLDAKERAVLYTLAVHSSHPASQAICAAIPASDARTPVAAEIREEVGMGMEACIDGVRYRLGRASFALSGGDEDATCFAREGQCLARLHLVEELRADAKQELAAFADAGFALALLSGDRADRVELVAASLGVAAEHALGECTPEDKAHWLTEHADGYWLFLGDGINDSLAAQQAQCSGTPALDRPFMASQCDFYLSTDKLAPIREGLQLAQLLRRVVGRNLRFALGYNALAVGLAMAGLMQPWLAALLMPASSIIVIAMTSISLSPMRRLEALKLPIRPADSYSKRSDIAVQQTAERLSWTS